MNDKLYKWAVPTWGAYLRKGLILEAKLLVVAPLKEAIPLVASPLRRTSTEVVRKITSCYIS